MLSNNAKVLQYPLTGPVVASKMLLRTSGQCNETLPFQIPTWKGNFNGALHATWSWSLLNAMQCNTWMYPINVMVDDQTNQKTLMVRRSLPCPYLSCCRLLVVMYVVHARFSCSSMLRKPAYAIDFAALTSWTLFIAVLFFVLFLMDFFLLVAFVCVIDAGGRYYTVDSMLKIGQGDNVGDYFRQKPANKSCELIFLEI